MQSNQVPILLVNSQLLLKFYFSSSLASVLASVLVSVSGASLLEVVASATFVLGDSAFDVVPESDFLFASSIFLCSCSMSAFNSS